MLQCKSLEFGESSIWLLRNSSENRPKSVLIWQGARTTKTVVRGASSCSAPILTLRKWKRGRPTTLSIDPPPECKLPEASHARCLYESARLTVADHGYVLESGHIGRGDAADELAHDFPAEAADLGRSLGLRNRCAAKRDSFS